MNPHRDESPEPLRLAVHMSSLPPTSEYDLPLRIHAAEMKRIYTLIEGLKGRSEVRRIAEDFLGRSASRLHSLSPVLQPLIRPQRFSWRERQAAAWIMGRAHLTPEQRESAAETLVDAMQGKLETETADQLRQVARRTLKTGTLAWILFSVFHPSFDPGPLRDWVFCLIATFPAVTVYSHLAKISETYGLQTEAANALGNLQAVEALPVLVAATQGRNLFWRNPQVRLQQTAREALPKILARLTDEDFGQIDTATMSGLCRLLNTGSEELAMAIIRAFAHVGDHTALVEIEKLAGGGGRAKKERRVQQAARACLPILQARIAREDNPHILLRGSVVPPTPTDQLLRPISDPSPFDPLELLRSSVAPDWKGSEEDILLVVQVLNALESNGDARALPYVEEILQTASVDARILNAARACLPVLRAHQELEQYSPSSFVNAPEPLTLRANV